MLNTLIALTENEYWSDIKNFKNEFETYFYNGKEILELVNMDCCDRFFDKGSNSELLIYEGRQNKYSCCYSEYYDAKIITCVYSKNGLVYEYNLSEAMKEIEDEFKRYVMSECERQWKDNQEEIYGEWRIQSDDIKAEYYNDMYEHLQDRTN